MAKYIVSPLVTRALDYLFKYGEKEISLYFGGREKLNELKTMMRMIQARLKDAERRQEADGGALVKVWLKEIRSVLYQLEDLFEEFTMSEELKKEEAEGSMTKAVCCYPRSKLSVFKMNKKVSQEALDIKTKLEQLTAAMNLLNFNVNTVDPGRGTLNMVNRKNDTEYFIVEKDVIGRDKEKELIVKMLMDSNHTVEDFSVIPIVGMGGLGKTTLAQLAYNDVRVEHFKLKIWVNVSDGISSFGELVKKVLKSVTDDYDPDMETGKLLSKLREFVNGKKFLLVLDDVWDEDRERWVKLKNSLSVGNPRSKILVTTRSEVVASNMGTVEPYILKGLTEDKSWELFKSLAFRKGQLESNPKMARIGHEIVKKCGNVPLAIRTIAAILCSRNTEDEWLSFMDKEIGKINEKQNSIMSTLKLSYDHLEPQLKQCFAYCSLFVEDYEFHIDELICLWMAQGFIVSEKEEKTYEVGYSYFMELLRRCFFQDVKRNSYGTMVGCKMHDLMRDLAKEVADECILADYRTPRNFFNDNILHVHCNISNDHIEWLGSPHIQSIRTFSSLYKMDLDKVFSCLKRVRTLELSHRQYKSLPDVIGELKHLRYLQVCVDRLPNAITKLQRLESLNLRGNRSIKDLPNDLYKLTTLRHLLFSEHCELYEMPPRFEELKSLQVLNQFIVGENNGLDALVGMNLIGELTIRYLIHRQSAISEAKRANLKDKKLSSLKIRWQCSLSEGVLIDVVDELLECLQPPPTLKSLTIFNWPGERFPSWGMEDFAHLFPNLVHINLNYSEKWQNLACFSQLLHLKILQLSNLEVVECVEVIRGRSNHEASSSTSTSSYAVSTTYFPCLEILSLSSMPRLRRWSKIEYGNLKGGQRQDVQQLQQRLFPRLIELTLYVCKILKSLPGTEFLFEVENHNLLQHYSSLKKLKIRNCEELDLWNVEDGDEVQANKFNSYFWKCLKSLTYLEFTNMSTPVSLPFNSCFWKCLKSLTYLELANMSTPVSLPSGIGDLITLEQLNIDKLYNLKALPDTIGNLTRLHRLEIHYCPKLESLSKSIRNLTKLQELHIISCPKLETKYRMLDGNDWSFIQHIPNVYMR